MPSFGKTGKDFVKYLQNKKAVINGDSGLKTWQKALNDVKSGKEGIIDLNFIGTGITSGSGAAKGTPPTYRDVWDACFVTLVRNELKKYGDTGQGLLTHAWWFQPTNMVLTYGGTWTSHTYARGFGTDSYTTSANATVSGTFTGTGLRIFYSQSTITSDFTVSIDEQSPITVTGNGTPMGTTYYDITDLENTAHTFIISNLATPGRENFRFQGILELNDTVTGIRVNNMGVPGIGAFLHWPVAGSTVTQTCSNSIPAKLSVVEIGANDYAHNITQSEFRDAVQGMITALKNAGGDVLIFVAGLIRTTRTTTWKDYVDVLYDLAKTNNCTLIDFSKLWGGYPGCEGGNIRNMTVDGIHPSPVGHADIAKLILKVIS